MPEEYASDDKNKLVTILESTIHDCGRKQARFLFVEKLMTKETKHKITWSFLVLFSFSIFVISYEEGTVKNLLAIAGILIAVFLCAHLVIYLEKNNWL